MPEKQKGVGGHIFIIFSSSSRLFFPSRVMVDISSSLFDICGFQSFFYFMKFTFIVLDTSNKPTS